jgi:hypothetical protein
MRGVVGGNDTNTLAPVFSMNAPKMDITISLVLDIKPISRSRIHQSTSAVSSESLEMTT